MSWRGRLPVALAGIALTGVVAAQGALGVEAFDLATAAHPLGEQTGWKTIDIKYGVTCGLRLDGSAWCWGDNRAGQIGDGTEIDRLVPTRAGSSNQWASISVGAMSTCGIMQDHSLWCWGDNRFGTLGLGDLVDRSTPTQVPGASDWSLVDTDGATTCGIRLDRGLWCWGYNYYGEVGDGTLDNRTSPVPVGPAAAKWAMAKLGEGPTCAIRRSGALYCWGNNTSGELGTGDTKNRLTPTRIAPGASWLDVNPGQDVFENHTCGITADHTLWCWGANPYGGLGTGDYNDRLTPYQINDSPRWLNVSAGAYNSCATRNDGTIWCWGANNWGQLGTGSTIGSSTPVRVGARHGWTWSVAGYGTTCAAKQTSQPAGIWCWGWNQMGSVGDGTTTDRLSPVRIRLPK